MAHFNLAGEDRLRRLLFTRENDICVFISHKKEDEEAAIVIGSYLTDVVGVNIYLDTQDCVLKEAVNQENDQRIVESIKVGLECCTHLLCLISDATRLSWWVPYEIGYADKQNADISVLKLKNVEDIPSYIKTKRVLLNTDDFLRYAGELNRYGTIFAETRYRSLSEKDHSVLKEYID